MSGHRLRKRFRRTRKAARRTHNSLTKLVGDRL